MVRKKTRLVHSLKLKNFLVECGLEPLEEIENPFRENFKSWKFANTKEFEQLMNIYTSEPMTFEEICQYVPEKASEGILFLLVDNSRNTEYSECKFYLYEKKRKIIIVK